MAGTRSDDLLPLRWAVVGGGILGAAAARRLSAAGHQVTLYEAAPALGGLASAWSLPAGDAAEGGAPDAAREAAPTVTTITWDRFYHVILKSDRRVLGLLAELGLDDELRWAKSRAACYAGGRALPASSGRELLGLPFLGPVAKLRLGLTVGWGALWRSPRRFEGITAARWLRRWSGRQATERLWLPLLRAKLGTQSERAAASFIHATIRRLVTARAQGGDCDLFGHVHGGYARVLEVLAEDLRRRGVEVLAGVRVAGVDAVPENGAGGLRVRLADGIGGARGADSYDRVLVTTAAPLTARLCPGLTEEERQRLAAVPYLGVLCPSVVLRRPVTGAYITYVTDPVPFTAVIEMTALVDPAELAGRTLIYLPRYTEPDDAAFDLGDTALRAEFLPAFLRMYGLTDDDVLSFTVARARYVLPVPTVGYTARVPAVTTSVPGLLTLGSAQIVDGTLNVEQTLALLDQLPIDEPAPVPADEVRVS
jgi:protoporphyrinogen oxidase